MKVEDRKKKKKSFQRVVIGEFRLSFVLMMLLVANQYSAYLFLWSLIL